MFIYIFQWSDDAYWYSESPSIVDAYDLGRLLSETVKVHGASLLRDPESLVQTMSGRGVTCDYVSIIVKEITLNSENFHKKWQF